MMDDPEYDEYAIGDSSDFGEDVFRGKYPASMAPALPGYGSEDQDHPAHNRMASDALLRDVHRRSKKALRLAQVTLGKNACMDDLEDRAVDYLMGMDEDALDASLARETYQEPFDAPAFDMGYLDMRLAALEAKIDGLSARAASRPAPLKAASKEEAEETEGKKEASARRRRTASLRRTAGRSLTATFVSSDIDEDGFVLEDEWVGRSDTFAALDTDGDGILAFTDLPLKAASKEEAEETEEEAEEMKAASARAAGGAKKKEDAPAVEEEDDEDEEDDDATEEEDEEDMDKEASSFFDGADLDPLALDADDDELLHLAYTQEKPKTAARTASKKNQPVDTLLRPQIKKASSGVKTLGNVRVASSNNEIDDLSRLWNTAPNVKDAF
jgi:hypothetical protein